MYYERPSALARIMRGGARAGQRAQRQRALCVRVWRAPVHAHNARA